MSEQEGEEFTAPEAVNASVAKILDLPDKVLVTPAVSGMASATKFELPLQISDLARLADDVMPAAGIGAGWNERHDCCASPRRVGRLAKPKAITGRPSGRPSLFAIRPSWVIVFARQQHIRVEQRQQKPLIPDDPLAR
jgi:hypothetical protein